MSPVHTEALASTSTYVPENDGSEINLPEPVNGEIKSLAESLPYQPI